MISQWLSWINCLLIGVILLVGLATGWLWLKQPEEIFCDHPIVPQSLLPKGAFDAPQESYYAIGEPVMSLETTPPSIQLPDLRQQLIYYGKNGRPDAQVERTLLHFSLNNNKVIVSIAPGERLYLIYDKKLTPPRYNFSPHNEASSIWIEAKPQDNEVIVQVKMKNEKGELVQEPEALAQFKLIEREFVRYAGVNWEMGNMRVDGTLLARQKARWFGPDKFLERHGGTDYQSIVGKQRVDLGENEDLYSLFMTVGDCFIWESNRWKNVIPGEASLAHPLLIVKKIEDRLMTLELWDVEGKGKILLNLLRSTEPSLIQNPHFLQSAFKFVGARTKTQCVFEINGERVLISPHDWLLMTAKGWKKLNSEEEIEDYVKRKLTGTLFVFEGMLRKEGQQLMAGILYNPTRSDFHAVEVPMQQGTVSKHAGEKDQREQAIKEHLKQDLTNPQVKQDLTNPHAPKVEPDLVNTPKG